MHRATPFFIRILAATALLGCAEFPTSATDGEVPSFSPRYVNFLGSAPFSFAGDTDCQGFTNSLVRCRYTIEDVGGLTLNIYRSVEWLMQPQCVHAKTLKAAPAKQQPPALPLWSRSTASGITATAGVIEATNVSVVPPQPTENPCNVGRGPYTTVVWVSLGPLQWDITAEDASDTESYKVAWDSF